MPLSRVLLLILVSVLVPLTATSQVGGMRLTGSPVRYRMVAEVQSGARIPFRLVRFQGDGMAKASLINGRERLELTGRKGGGDTIVYPLVVFDGDLRLVPTAAGGLKGYYTRNDSRKGTLRVPVSGSPERSQVAMLPSPEQKYDVLFSAPDGSSPYPAVGHIQSVGSRGKAKVLRGTFETTTGDYRFLEGEQTGDSLWLSCFDGAHLFLFTARQKGDSLIRGRFYATGPGNEVWRGKRNAKAKLPDALARVTTRPGVPPGFSALDTNGTTITLDDPRFKGKPVILQLSGSWCPNCMDETTFLSDWYRSPERRDIEVVSLGFEWRPERSYWKNRLATVQRRLDVPYLLTYAGRSNKDSAAARLPFLSQVEAFPTTIFLNRRHEVVAVHTGYSGPATGDAHTQFRQEFKDLIKKLLD